MIINSGGNLQSPTDLLSTNENVIDQLFSFYLKLIYFYFLCDNDDNASMIC